MIWGGKEMFTQWGNVSVFRLPQFSVYMERLGLEPVSHCFPRRSNSVGSPEC